MSSDIKADISEAIFGLKPDRVFYLFENNTYQYCMPLLSALVDSGSAGILILKPGEENKSISQLMQVWDFFEDKGASRNSLLITVGGGMLTDLGGFAASTFKRGMSFINVPTSLLAMVDASVGGKTGINYHGLKNEIGTIRQPDEVLIHTSFLNTLDQENFLSGFAEMLKAGLINDKSLWEDLSVYDLDRRDIEELRPLIWRSVQIKNAIVEIDPEEAGDRRALNFGHTFAHAFESLSMARNSHVHHGYAVAYGMVFEAELSVNRSGLSRKECNLIKETIRKVYGSPPFDKEDISSLIHLMRSDKKNQKNQINITMISQIGNYRINNYVDENLVAEVLEDLLPGPEV